MRPQLDAPLSVQQGAFWMPQGLGVSRLLFDVRGRGVFRLWRSLPSLALQNHVAPVRHASFRIAGSVLDASGPGGVWIAS